MKKCHEPKQDKASVSKSQTDENSWKSFLTIPAPGYFTTPIFADFVQDFNEDVFSVEHGAFMSYQFVISETLWLR
ncbi:hypothetical protein [Candidatus Hydrogenosomobacter endosymbioticus]|uniref:Uncharacterized protein n=1 Tax=Candidatus Hydrogenosomobacter endosymbioticus TaxID=2558174 RepID=A0ABN6L3M1_9PROT|nr:hypothetical protein [Candidatus Hydrogenosomobacter endosymbioticus]BDB96505.1 hypothetical protein HYD_6380 [Candidatus Hydrogenosomobacter endosymbioticus]